MEAAGVSRMLGDRAGREGGRMTNEPLSSRVVKVLVIILGTLVILLVAEVSGFTALFR